MRQLEMRQVMRVRDEAGDETVRDEAGDERVRDEAGDERVRDEAGDERVRDEAGDERVRDEAGDERVRDEAGDERVRDEAGGKRVRDEAGGKRVRDEAGGERVRDEAGGERVRDEAGERVRDEAGDERVRDEAGDERVRDEAVIVMDVVARGTNIDQLLQVALVWRFESHHVELLLGHSVTKQTHHHIKTAWRQDHTWTPTPSPLHLTPPSSHPSHSNPQRLTQTKQTSGQLETASIIATQEITHHAKHLMVTCQ